MAGLRFLTPGGPGNPFVRQIAGFRRAVCRAVSQRDLEKLVRTLMERALRGDHAAAALLLSYTVGKPANATSPDKVDVDEWQLLKETTVRPGELERFFHSLPADEASEMMRGIWPFFVRQMRERMAAAARGDLPEPTLPPGFEVKSES